MFTLRRGEGGMSKTGGYVKIIGLVIGLELIRRAVRPAAIAFDAGMKAERIRARAQTARRGIGIPEEP
jgi:hypothetical protein